MAGRDILQAIAAAWPAYRALKTVSSGEPLYQLVIRDLPDTLNTWLPEQRRNGLIQQGSTGAGNITSAPWIATFDPKVTQSATEGFYVVYLYSIDLQRLYLSIAFGTTQFKDQFPNVMERHQRLRSAADRLRALVPQQNDLLAGDLDLAATARDRLHTDYEAGNIFAIRYDLAALPEENQLKADYLKIIALYDALVSHSLLPEPQRLLEAEVDTPIEVQAPVVLDFKPRPPKKLRTAGDSKPGVRLSKESKKVGDQGERLVVALEEQQLVAAGFDPAKVIWHAQQGQTPGWDITSCDQRGKPIYIEVKASVGGKVSELILTSNEWAAAERHRDRYFIYLVTDVMAARPKIEKIQDPWGLVQGNVIMQRVFTVALNLASPPVQAGPNES